MNETLVKKADHETSLACHSRVNCVTREEIAQQCILSSSLAGSESDNSDQNNE